MTLRDDTEDDKAEFRLRNLALSLLTLFFAGAES
jgi:hypothetical protein